MKGRRGCEGREICAGAVTLNRNRWPRFAGVFFRAVCVPMRGMKEAAWTKGKEREGEFQAVEKKKKGRWAI